ncbi:zona pellucida sperm-binding protein 4-like isoform X1 [Pygocentrus nattereri]|uniref:ZP domain-containing protein n=1 Tax=Pygocentrus nattereri TaxID=42514 RepID=A0A3B4EIN5_PYGNA|nr:zona pellucida sperm-binding protein 4-like isoform X1 [Pygocentrus nattereri]
MCWLWSVTLTLLLMNQIQRFRSQSEAPRETVTCRSDDMFLIIHKRGLQSSPRLYVQDRHGNYLSMRDHARQCLYDLLETPGFLILRVSHSSCHVHRRVRGGSITFWVNIVVEKASRSKQASVFREAPFRVTVSCTYALINTSSSTSLTIRDPKSTTVPALKKEGVLRAQMRFATDSSFRNFYEDQLHPTMHTLGEPVFVEIFVLKREDKDLVLLLHDCWATPSADPQDERRWDLLREGCPQRRADYSVEVLEVQPGDGVKFPDLHKWLKIKMFSFVEREDAFESVYLHCDIEVCKGAPCRRTCNRKKRQSTVQWDLKERLVLQRDAVCGGPLLLTR